MIAPSVSLPVSLDCLFMIAPSVSLPFISGLSVHDCPFGFSTVYLWIVCS
jgi:hypothetical protein